MAGKSKKRRPSARIAERLQAQRDPQTRTDFGAILAKFLKDLSLDKETFFRLLNAQDSALSASATGSVQTVYAWLNGHRIPTRSTVIRIASVLATRLAELKLANKPGDLFGCDLGFILFSLLNAAGFDTTTPPASQVWWDRLQEARSTAQPLPIAWINLPRFAGENTGDRLCLEISETAFGLLGASTILVQQPSWDELVENIRNGSVAAAAPILAGLPYQPKDISLSDSIGLSVRHVGIVPASRVAEFQVGDPFLSGRINPDKCLFLRTLGAGVSDLFVSLLSRDWQGMRTPTFTIKEAVDRLTDTGRAKSANQIECMVTAEPLADELVSQHPQVLAKAKLPLANDLPLPLVFGFRRSESRLRNALNSMIGQMKRSGMIGQLIRSYGDLGNIMLDLDIAENQSTKK